GGGGRARPPEARTARKRRPAVAALFLGLPSAGLTPPAPRAIAFRYHTKAPTQAASRGHQARSRREDGNQRRASPARAITSRRVVRRARTERRRNIQKNRARRTTRVKPAPVTTSRRTTARVSSVRPATGSHAPESIRAASSPGRQDCGVAAGTLFGRSQFRAERKRPEGSCPSAAAAAKACSSESDSGSRRATPRPEVVVSRTAERAGTA